MNDQPFAYEDPDDWRLPIGDAQFRTRSDSPGRVGGTDDVGFILTAITRDPELAARADATGVGRWCGCRALAKQGGRGQVAGASFRPELSDLAALRGREARVALRAAQPAARPVAMRGGPGDWVRRVGVDPSVLCVPLPGRVVRPAGGWATPSCSSSKPRLRSRDTRHSFRRRYRQVIVGRRSLPGRRWPAVQLVVSDLRRYRRHGSRTRHRSGSADWRGRTTTACRCRRSWCSRSMRGWDRRRPGWRGRFSSPTPIASTSAPKWTPCAPASRTGASSRRVRSWPNTSGFGVT